MEKLIPRDAAIGALEERRNQYRQDTQTWLQIQIDVQTIRAIPTIDPACDHWGVDPAATREAALREAVKSLRDWQADLNRHLLKDTAVTVGMAADIVDELIGEKK